MAGIVPDAGDHPKAGREPGGGTANGRGPRLDRDPRAAADGSHDLVIVGGGIYGATLALEAARRGMRPLLLERDDFGGGTSWNSLRIIHGGLRYLQDVNLRRFRTSVRERRWFLRHFPDLVEPLPCLMPLYGRGLRRSWILRTALAVNDLLSYHRNRGVPSHRKLPAGEALDRQETLSLFPAARRDGLVAGALWYDARMPDSERLLVEILLWAAAEGATCLNYVEATDLRVEDGRVRGVEAIDRMADETLEFSAPAVANCAGPAVRDVARRFDRDIPSLFHPSIAFNLHLDRAPLSPTAVAITAPRAGARTCFLHPWRGRILAGTWHAPRTGRPGPAEPREREIASFLDTLNAAAPALDLSTSDVLRVHAGLLPAVREGTDELAERAVIRDHGTDGGPRGFFSISGVKYTTARDVAERALRQMLPVSNLDSLPPARGGRPSVRSPISADAFVRMARRDEGRAADYLRQLAGRESALRAEDILMRRTGWGTDPEEADAVQRHVRALFGRPSEGGENPVGAVGERLPETTGHRSGSGTAR